MRQENIWRNDDQKLQNLIKNNVYIFKIFSHNSYPKKSKKKKSESQENYFWVHISQTIENYKNKEKMSGLLKTLRHTAYKRTTVRIPTDFLSELRENQGEMKIISGKRKISKYISTRPYA